MKRVFKAAKKGKNGKREIVAIVDKRQADRFADHVRSLTN